MHLQQDGGGLDHAKCTVRGGMGSPVGGLHAALLQVHGANATGNILWQHGAGQETAPQHHMVAAGGPEQRAQAAPVPPKPTRLTSGIALAAAPLAG